MSYLLAEKGSLKAMWETINAKDSFGRGEALGRHFLAIPLVKHLIVLSEGLQVNGSDLASGLREVLGEDISVTGGLAGDHSRFKNTCVIDEDGKASENVLFAHALVGEEWKIHFGSMGGWNTFGLERQVTRSKENVVYEIDHQPALDLYKYYLGKRSAELPASGLLFPLSMRMNAEDPPLVRTILSVNEKEKSLTFAGDIPQGSFVKLMKANIDRLIDGAGNAALIAIEHANNPPELALLVSCVGRRLVLRQLAEEELEEVQDQLNAGLQIGFYS